METQTTPSQPSDPSKSDDVAFSVNPTPFINRSGVKEFALAYCQRTERLHLRKKTRVSADFLIYVNNMVKDAIRKRVDSQTPAGITIR